MEARCQQFLTDAQRPNDSRTIKDIQKLKQFLFKNQVHARAAAAAAMSVPIQALLCAAQAPRRCTGLLALRLARLA